MGKGSVPRPYSVDQKTFGNNYDAIFGKKNKVTEVAEQVTQTACGCGRSPTGNCIGWHSLSEQAFQEALSKYKTE